MSHEVRTPLNTIQLGLEILASEMGKAIGRLSDRVDPNETLTMTGHMASCGNSCSGTLTSTDDNAQLVSDMGEWLQLLRDVSESAGIAVTVFSDLLNYDKIKSKTLQLELTYLPPCTMVQTAVHPFYIQARQADVTLSLTFDDEVIKKTKDSDQPVVVLGDAMKLGLVIKNLLSNSLKFTPQGGNIKVEVSYLATNETHKALPAKKLKETFCCSSRSACHHVDSEGLTRYLHELGKFRREGTLVVTVTDSGVGMTVDNLRNLFQEGVQFNANRLQAGGGSGLGLWISEGIVTLHSGTLSASSTGIGCGSTFRLALPLISGDTTSLRAAADRDTSTRQSECAADQMESGNITKSKEQSPPVRQRSVEMSNATVVTDLSSKSPMRHILLVDDAISNRKLLAHILRAAGYGVADAGDGQQCLEIIEESPAMYDLIFMDFGESCACVNASTNLKLHIVPLIMYVSLSEMPRMNGPTATRILRERGITIPIIGVTGNVLSDDVTYFLKSGANKVLPKPLTKKSINDIIQEFIQC